MGFFQSHCFAVGTAIHYIAAGEGVWQDRQGGQDGEDGGQPVMKKHRVSGLFMGWDDMVTFHCRCQ